MEVGGLVGPEVEQVGLFIYNFLHLLRGLGSLSLFLLYQTLDEHILVLRFLKVFLGLEAVCPQLISLSFYACCLCGNLEEMGICDLGLLSCDLPCPALVLKRLLDLLVINSLAPHLLLSHI